ncbi:MAG: Arc family DNA-binding protein [Bryobacteraceae bacterium]|nr:Arc family DNA-binding protein [Bryobacteraceae bacterium]
MAERKTFLLRMDGKVLDALRKWADDDLRSLNGQIEFVLRHALRERGRLKEPKDSAGRPAPPEEETPQD